MKQRPHPPRPDLRRRPRGSFGWIEASLLHQGWLANIGAEGAAVLTLLALAADHHGASWFGRDRMARALSMTRDQVDDALGRLLQLGLVDHRPWSPGHPDGVWQILPVPDRGHTPKTKEPTSIAQALAALGLAQ